MQEFAPWVAIAVSLGALVVSTLAWRSNARIAAIEEERDAAPKRVKASILEYRHDNESAGPQTYLLVEIAPPGDGSVVAFRRIEVDGGAFVPVDVKWGRVEANGPALVPALRTLDPERVAITVHHVGFAGATNIRLIGEREDATRSPVTCDISIPG